MYDLPTTMPADVVGTLDQVPDLAAYFPSKTKGKHQTMPAQPASADGPAGADAPPTPPALDRQVAQQCRGGRPSRTLSRSRRHKLLLVAHRTRVAVALDDAAYVPTRHPVAVSPSASLMLTRATPCAASQITCAPHLALRKIATLNAALPTLLTDVNGWRKAMDSRVHRAGVACPVHVETLAAAPDLLSLPDHMLAEFLVALPRASFNALAYVYNPNPPKLPLYKYVVAGGGAGIAEILVMYPLDVVKTRLQLQVSKAGSEVAYSGVVDCLTKIVRAEGPLALYRGIASPILAEAPKRAWKFASNEQFKQAFKGIMPAPIIPALAGASAGLTEAGINAPFELVKVRLQAKGSAYTSTLNAATSILRHEGVGALYRGASAQAARNAVWNGVYFALIFELKAAFPDPTSKSEELLRNMAAGTIGGTSRMNNMPKGEPLPSITACLRDIYLHEGGARAMWKGLTPRLLRLGPGGGIMLVAFDYIASLLG
ncbi:uncharacterized protein AMSG_03602 [Thecamonas trahens ATCC 50062]|uniref:Uncharacterized protein n=1 Tax=Thecamonas trahens ATCC 50062 TaxID=461836 RepID=A0A0L0D4D7_THETB|nr:hypothetical protein AMSG_03602 [Thecamonas trahens ATCC 50062]KNC47174.1 hypothetical protein AMSG_03602 [Thecamonas trahens ATCC 50062]|eukprot:XP_013759948.1 hypothetical protein AMSG_03602 [Thecamonas trahens ATCC 50062]